MQDIQGVWDSALDIVRGELNTPTFKTWFEHTSPIGVTDQTVLVSAQNEFARDWLESRYSGLLSAALTQVTGTPFSVVFKVSDAPAEETVVIPSPAEATAAVVTDMEAAEQRRVREATEGEFNPSHTFESFVMGSSNRFAYHAALAVAETPGGAYNPLLIYGGVGLGKTHLLQAIGHYVKSSFPHMKVKYCSSEQFTNDFINSIGNRDKSRIEGFRRQYRTIDVLLVDDIQFLAGKEGTQEEFFHTFNTLQQAGKQIVLSADRPPKDIGDLTDRLRSRFGMGLPADI
jgi:chromosomal replication initiator protein